MHLITSHVQEFVRVGVFMESALLRKAVLVIWDGKESHVTQVLQPDSFFHVDLLNCVYILLNKLYVFITHINNKLTSSFYIHFH